MILPVFLSPVQENEKTTLVKVSRGQRGPWRGTAFSPHLGERRQTKAHVQPCLVLVLLPDKSGLTPEYQGNRGPGTGWWGELCTRSTTFNSTVMTAVVCANVVDGPDDAKIRGQGPLGAYSPLRGRGTMHSGED